MNDFIGPPPPPSLYPQFNLNGNMSPLKAGLVGSLPTLIGGGLSAISQIATNEINYRRQLDMYKENREYNEPKAQMQRFMEAGLNPNLIYGQTNTASPVAVGNAVSPTFDFIGTAGQSMVDKYNQQTQSNISQVVAFADHLLKEINYNYLPKEKQQALDIAVQTFNKLVNENSLFDLDKKIKELTRDNLELNYNYDKDMKELGFPPDVTASERAVIGGIAKILEFFRVMTAREFVGTVFSTGENYLDNIPVPTWSPQPK